MSNPKKYVGPVTGRVYDLAAGERIDAEAEGIGFTGEKGSPKARCGGREVYNRILVRLRTPGETLTCRPIENAEDFARRVAIIEHWYNVVMRRMPPMMLEFIARPMTEEEVAQCMAEESDEAVDN